MIRVCIVLFHACLLTAHAATAHEFWIEPESYVIKETALIRADLKVGQNFSGAVFAYLPDRFQNFTITGSQGTTTINGVIGDTPAVSVEPPASGLQVIAYHSTADLLTFNNMEEFTEYVAYEGNDWAVAKHRALGLPESGFQEAYTRCAKALVQVGTDRIGSDSAVGLPLEFVALRSPYDGATFVDLPVVLLRQGEPMVGQQINVFFKGDAGEPHSYVTDANGRASIDVSRPGRYLINAVWMKPVDAGGEVAWESYWASLTFEISSTD